MKKLLFLAGLIMVTVVFTECKSDDGLKNEMKNYSLACIGGNIIEPQLALCEAKIINNELHFILDRGAKTFSYNLSDILDECLNEVKKGQVTLAKTNLGLIPVMVSENKSSNIMYGSFIFKSVLKDAELQKLENMDMDQKIESMLDAVSFDNAACMTYIRGLFKIGLCKPGMKMYEKGMFFFGESDFKPETTEKQLSGGNYSLTMGLDKVLRLCQTKVTKKEVIIRMEDGKTYRYPKELYSSEIDNYSISAGQVPYGWHPAVIRKEDGYYVISVLNDDKFYGFGNKFEELKNENANNFLRAKGFEPKPDKVLY